MITEERERGGAFFGTVSSTPYQLPAGYKVYILSVTISGATVVTPPVADHRKSGKLEGAPTLYLYVTTNAVTVQDSSVPAIATAIATDTLYQLAHALDTPTGEYIFLPELAFTAKTFPTIAAIVATGGASASTACQTHSWSTNLWTSTTAMLTARTGGAGGRVGDRFYVAQGGSTDAHESRSTVSATPSARPVLSTARDEGVAGSYRDRVVYFGGSTVVTDYYNVTSDVLVAGNSLPSTRTKGGSTNFPARDRTVLHAGLPELSPGFFFHYPSDTYESIDVAPGSDRRSFCSFYSNGLSHVEGGYDDSAAEYKDTHEAFNPVTRTWSTLTSRATARRSHFAFDRGEYGYTTGGETSSGATTGADAWVGSVWAAWVGINSIDANNQCAGGVVA